MNPASDNTAKSVSPDPWDVALFGSAAASMYRSQPSAAKPAVPPLQSSVPRDLTEVTFSVPINKEGPALPPLVNIEPSRFPPPPPKKELPLSPSVAEGPVAEIFKNKLPALPPPHPRERSAFLVALLFIIPLFAAGFYVAEYIQQVVAAQNSSSNLGSVSATVPEPAH